jgi:hypothetical protein
MKLQPKRTDQLPIVIKGRYAPTSSAHDRLIRDIHLLLTEYVAQLDTSQARLRNEEPPLDMSQVMPVVR